MFNCSLSEGSDWNVLKMFTLKFKKEESRKKIPKNLGPRWIGWFFLKAFLNFCLVNCLSTFSFKDQLKRLGIRDVEASKRRASF